MFLFFFNWLINLNNKIKLIYEMNENYRKMNEIDQIFLFIFSQIVKLFCFNVYLSLRSILFKRILIIQKLDLPFFLLSLFFRLSLFLIDTAKLIIVKKATHYPTTNKLLIFQQFIRQRDSFSHNPIVPIMAKNISISYV